MGCSRVRLAAGQPCPRSPSSSSKITRSAAPAPHHSRAPSRLCPASDTFGVSAIALGAAALPRLVALDLSLNHRVAAQGMRALTKALAAGAWPHMPTHPRRDPRGKAGEGRLRAGFGVPPLDDEGLRDELLVALDARQQAAVARQEAAAI